MTELIFLKHGEILRTGGSHLSPKGINDSLAIAKTLSRYDLSAIFSSPAPRCIETVSPLSEKAGLPITINSLLKERMLSSQILSSYRNAVEIAFLRPDFAFKGGESINSAKARLLQFLKGTVSLELGVAAVSTHGVNVSILMSIASHDDYMECWKRLGEGDCIHFKVERKFSQLSISLVNHEKIG